MFDPKNRENSIENLKKRLYTRGEFGRRILRRGKLHSHEIRDGSWGDEKNEISPTALSFEKKPQNPFRVFFIVATIFFIMAVFYAAYQFFAGGNIVSSKNINVSVFGPAFVSGGDELSLQIQIENKNSVPLEFAQILVSYPRGAGSANSSSTPDFIRKEIPLEKISAGGTEQEILKLILYGEEGSQQDINFTLEYRVQGSNAIFQKEIVYPVKISSAPITLSVSGPKDTNSGQEITLAIKALSNAPKNVPDILLQIDYPSGFQLKSSEPKPSYGNNIWRLGDFQAGGSRQIILKGILSGENNEERTFRILSGSASSDDDKSIGVIFNSAFHTMVIHRPFLDAIASINGETKESVAVSGNREVRGAIIWRNNLPTRINNAQIIMRFSGNALDRSSVTSQNGFYNSNENSIIWDRNNMEDFLVVEPGASGSLPFTFRPAPLFSSLTGFLKEPKIVLQITVRGDVNLADGGSGATSITTEYTVKVATDLQLLPKVSYATGPFSNTGPIPPIAEKETTYTITWSVINSANDVDNGKITATLPQYVFWAEQTYPKEEDVSYDEATRTVTWRLNTILFGTGYQKSARSASFKVKLIPSISHVGSSVSLTGEAVLSGFDRFSGAEIQNVKNPVTTTLSGNTSSDQGNGIVASPK